MWHASIKSHRLILPASKLEEYARWALDGVGDHRLGEWVEHHGQVLHLRRRLSAAEQEPIGDVLDVRGTPEAERRTHPYAHLLPPGWSE